MHHVPPLGATDPDQTYDNGNILLGQKGSRVDCALINMLLAELKNVVIEAGMTLDPEDQTQIAQAIQMMATGGDMYKADNLAGLADAAAARDNLGILQNRGADIAAAATVNLGTATSYFVRVTGSGGPITSFGNGTDRKWCFVEFTGTPVLTHSADLALPRSANIQVQAGDTALFIKTGASSWHCVFFQRKTGQALEPLPGSVVQTVSTVNSSNLSISGSIPIDNTTPEITEGTGVMSQAITPKYATSKLLIRATVFLGTPSNSNNHGVIALFSDSVNIGAGLIHGEQSGVDFTTSIIEAVIDAVDLSSRVISVRIGRTSSTFVLNADGGGNAVFNGQSKATLIIQEIKQ